MNIPKTMASYYYNPQQQHHQPSSASSHSSSSSHNHHGGRSRRAPRLSASHNPHKQFRGVRSPRDMVESPVTAAARARFEAGRSFDLDDDLEFCPGLLTEDDVSILRPQLLIETRLSLSNRGEWADTIRRAATIHSFFIYGRVPFIRLAAFLTSSAPDSTVSASRA